MSTLPKTYFAFELVILDCRKSSASSDSESNTEPRLCDFDGADALEDGKEDRNQKTINCFFKPYTKLRKLYTSFKNLRATSRILRR